ncbi:hypothetical protein [Spiroplasma endosymbiont of Othius punctulatus]|uniref:hypothetical protein n=1 Tax=Spiroplasma endosymbiont of Othius punctulatus TaxID=3066289 RepID=UPI0030CAC01E
MNILLSLLSASMIITPSAGVVMSANNIIEINNNNEQKTETIDISEASGSTEVLRKLPYFVLGLNDSKAEFQGAGATALSKAGLEVSWLDLEVLSRTNAITGEPLTADDTYGKNGAGKIWVDTVFVPNETGVEKGLYGELRMFVVLDFQTLDFSTEPGLQNYVMPPRAMYRWPNSNIEVIKLQLKTWFYEEFRNSEIGRTTPLIFGPSVLDTNSKLYIPGTMTEFTQDNIDEMQKLESVKLSIIISASDYGEKMGLFNSTMISFTYIKDNA